MDKDKKAGFTLIECLIVFVVLVVVIWLFVRGCSSDKKDGSAVEDNKVSQDLILSQKPSDFNPGPEKIEEYVHENQTGVGSDKFMIVSPMEGRKYMLRAFTQDCSIADLCWMMTQVYNEYISPRIVQGETLSPYDLAMLELAISSHMAYVATATTQMYYGMRGGSSDSKMMKGVRFHLALDGWQTGLADMIDTLCLKWRQAPKGQCARRCGWYFSGSDMNWLWDLRRRIVKEEIMDIRWPNLYPDNRGWWDKMTGNDLPQHVSFNLDNAMNLSIDWKEIQTIVFNESVMALMRMNKEITEALSRVSDVKGYPELHKLIEAERPRVKNTVFEYCIAYSDLPFAVLCKATYDQTKAVDYTFSTDRPRVKQLAAQFTRAISDGQMQQFSVSATSFHLAISYHGYLKKLLGEDDYQNYKNSIRWRKSDPLKLE